MMVRVVDRTEALSIIGRFRRWGSENLSGKGTVAPHGRRDYHVYPERAGERGLEYRSS
jgi:hypothetical protein